MIDEKKIEKIDAQVRARVVNEQWLDDLLDMLQQKFLKLFKVLALVAGSALMFKLAVLFFFGKW